MDAAIEALLAELDAREVAERKFRDTLSHRELMVQRESFLISIGREAGIMVNLLAKAMEATSILELGTSYGYSAIWLAEAARATGGRVVSLDLDANKQRVAREHLARVGLDHYVEFLAGDALKILPELRGPFDFVLLDLWKEIYVPAFDLFYPKLKPGALIAADNMLYPPYARPEAERYRQHVRAHETMESVLLPIGSGIELSRFAG
jgi:predicted O-methyltransferase YrrM